VARITPVGNNARLTPVESNAKYAKSQSRNGESSKSTKSKMKFWVMQEALAKVLCLWRRPQRQYVARITPVENNAKYAKPHPMRKTTCNRQIAERKS